MKQYSAVVVGLGSIGQGLDYEENLDNSSFCLTHASAFSQHYGFKLIAGVDSSIDLCEKFKKKFN